MDTFRTSRTIRGATCISDAVFMIYNTDDSILDTLTDIDLYTQGWWSRKFEATGGHSSVLLDRRLDPRQESRDAGEDGVVLPTAVAPKPFADDANKNVAIFLIHNCKWPTTVALG